MLWRFLLVVNIMAQVRPQKENIDCKMSQIGQMYEGFENSTIDGMSCQKWEETVPHFHLETKNQSHKNYCRNPTLFKDGVWCFTNSPIKRWQYCGVSYCPEKTCSRGVDYTGIKQTSKYDVKCSPWIFSNEKNWNFPENSTIKAENFCRNPSGDKNGPWCYVSIEKPPKTSSCFHNFCGSCSKVPSIEGPVSILLDYKAYCPKLCILMVDYNDSNPKIKFPLAIIKVQFVNSYSDFLSDFNISIVKAKKRGIDITIQETRYNSFICLNGSDVYLSEHKPCIYSAECSGGESSNHIQQFVIRSSEHKCLIRHAVISPCYPVHFISNPAGYIFNPESFSIVKRNNDNPFSVIISKLYPDIRGVPIPKVKKVLTTANSCVRVSMNDTYVMVFLITTMSCKCRFLSYFSVRIVLEDFMWMVIERTYYFSYETQDIVCRMFPEISTGETPIISNNNELFYFFAEETALYFEFIAKEVKHCLKERNALQSAYYFKPNECCKPICHIIVSIYLLRYDGLRRLGQYTIINSRKNVLTFYPDLVYILFGKKTFTCHINNLIAHVGLKKILYFVHENGTETNISEYILNKNVERFKLKCTSVLHSTILNMTIVLETINRVFIIVRKFKAKIEWGGILRIGDAINCTTEHKAVPYSINLDWTVLKGLTMAENYKMNRNSFLNILDLKFSPTMDVGTIMIICIASLTDVYNTTYYTFRSYDWIMTELRGPKGSLIYPLFSILKINDSIKCSNAKSNKQSLGLKRFDGYSRFSIPNGKFVISEELRSGLYQVTCLMNFVKFTTSISELKLLLIRDLFFYPDLPFYILNKHGDVKCLRDRDSLHSTMQTKLVLKANNLANNSLLLRNGFFYFSLTPSGLVTLNCSLIWTRESIVANTSNEGSPLIYRDQLLSFITKEVFLIRPFILYIKESLKHFINLPIKCRTNSYFLMEQPNIYIIRWETFPKLRYYLKNGSSSEIYFPMTSPPDIYNIKCYFNYQEFNLMMISRTMMAETTIELTAVDKFLITPNRTVFIKDDKICCQIFAIVPISLSLKINNTLTTSNGTICKILPKAFPSKLDIIICELVYNERRSFINRNILLLDEPESLFITPEKPRLDMPITCFPYQNIFSIKNHDDVRFDIVFEIISQPTNEIISDIIKDYDLTIYTSRNGVIKLNEYMNFFGIYTFSCEANITILNKKFYLAENKTLEVKGFSESINVFNEGNYEPYLLIWMVAILHSFFQPFFLILLDVAIKKHRARTWQLARTLETIGFRKRVHWHTIAEKYSSIYLRINAFEDFSEIFKITYAYAYIARSDMMNAMVKNAIDEYNVAQPYTDAIQAILGTFQLNSFHSETSPANKMKLHDLFEMLPFLRKTKEVVPETQEDTKELYKGNVDLFEILKGLRETKRNREPAHPQNDILEEVAEVDQNEILPSTRISFQNDSKIPIEDEDLWNPYKKKMLTYQALSPQRICEERIKLVNMFQKSYSQTKTRNTRERMKSFQVSEDSENSSTRTEGDTKINENLEDLVQIKKIDKRKD